MEKERFREMEIKILKKTLTELKIEIKGENHTFCNALQKVLLEDDTVEMAGYDLPHPLISDPIVYVRTRGQRKPEMALRDAVKKLQKQSNEFRRTFQRALKAWSKE